MGFYLEIGLYYWEGKPKPEADAIEVPQRPNALCIWDGTKWQDNSRQHYIYNKENKCFELRPQAEIDVVEIILKEAEGHAVILGDKNLLKIFWIIGKAIIAVSNNQELPADFIALKDKLVAKRDELGL